MKHSSRQYLLSLAIMFRPFAGLKTTRLGVLVMFSTQRGEQYCVYMLCAGWLLATALWSSVTAVLPGWPWRA